MWKPPHQQDQAAPSAVAARAAQYRRAGHRAGDLCIRLRHDRGIGAVVPRRRHAADDSSWGNMLAEGRQYLQRGPWMIAFPGACLALLVLTVNVLGDALRDALDPRLSRSGR